MGSVNKVFLLGNLGGDPESRTTNTGKTVCNFTLATSEGPRNSERTEWHRIVCWDKTAELCAQYLSKGQQAHIEGRIQTRKWTDRDGNERYTTEIVADRVTFMRGGEARPAARPTGGGYSGFSQTTTPDVPYDGDDDDRLPF